LRGMSASTAAMAVSTARRIVVMCGVCAADSNFGNLTDVL